MAHKHIMVDLETLGTRAGSVIASIGAVEFDRTGVLSEFYRRIDRASAVEVGMTIDAETVNWWMLQSEEARAEMARPGDPISAVLEDFASWIDGARVYLWGNGAAFDNALLAEAYRLCGLPIPWKFWDDRCYRTIKGLYGAGVKMERTGTHHNAVDDARDQAEHLIRIFEEKSFPDFS